MTDTGRAKEPPARIPGETGLAYVRRLAGDWMGLTIPPADPPPPPPGQLRVPRRVQPYRAHLEAIWRGDFDRNRQRDAGEDE
jgi:hypothetical protein